MLAAFAIFALLAAAAWFLFLREPPVDPGPFYWPAGVLSEEGKWTGRLVRIDRRLAVLTVRGSPAARGEAHGRLLQKEVRGLVSGVRAVLKQDAADNPEAAYARLLAGAVAMKRHLEPDVRAELDACAAAAGVAPDELVLAQLFGDVDRAQAAEDEASASETEGEEEARSSGRGLVSRSRSPHGPRKVDEFMALDRAPTGRCDPPPAPRRHSFACSSFAAFGEATAGGRPLVGRNFDFAGHGLEESIHLILQEIPEGPGAGQPFVTVGYAGILNGWSAMNADGLFASNNTLLGESDSVEGISTCFLLRKIVERGRTVEDGVDIVRKGPRACGTGMLVAGRNRAGAWDARFVEFDHDSLAVVEPERGVVLATNTRQRLPFGGIAPAAVPSCRRFRTLKAVLDEWRGRLAFDSPSPNPAAKKGVYMAGNLHCVLADPESRRFRLAVSPKPGKPAARQAFRTFRIEKTAVVEVKP